MKRLTFRLFQRGGNVHASVMEIPFTEAMAIENRDGMAKVCSNQKRKSKSDSSLRHFTTRCSMTSSRSSIITWLSQLRCLDQRDTKIRNLLAFWIFMVLKNSRRIVWNSSSSIMRMKSFTTNSTSISLKQSKKSTRKKEFLGHPSTIKTTHVRSRKKI